MRPQQQNRRMRGRNNNNNNNNRKGPNPLTRSYESNGPDVKIRGSAQQIADKYMTLARDAQSAGDRVMAENYLQHAEHYNRIIAAAQAQMPQQQQVRDNRDDFDDEDERDEADQQNQQTTDEQPRTPSDGSGPQPYINGTPAEVALNSEARPEEGGEQRAERVNGNGHGGDAAGQDGEEGGQRRSRRSRRGRGRPGQDRGFGDEQAAAGDDTGSGEEAPAANADSEVSDPVG